MRGIDLEAKDMWDKAQLNDICETIVERAMEDAAQCIDVSDEPFESLAAEWAKKGLAEAGIYVEDMSVELTCHDQAQARFKYNGEWWFIEDYIPGIGNVLHYKEMKLKRAELKLQQEQKKRKDSMDTIFSKGKRRENKKYASEKIAKFVADYIRDSKSDVKEKKEQVISGLINEAAIRAIVMLKAESSGIKKKKAKKIADKIVERWARRNRDKIICKDGNEYECELPDHLEYYECCPLFNGELDGLKDQYPCDECPFGRMKMN